MSSLNTGDYDHDVFIAHASEDKRPFVATLALRLETRGLRVWYDEWELRVGDNLRQRIEQGLVRSAYGVAVLSPRFFAKDWPQRELDGMFALELAEGRSRIIPVWLDTDQPQVAQFSPILANTRAALAAQGTDAVVTEICATLTRDGVSTDAFYRHKFTDQEVDLVELARSNQSVIDGYHFTRCRLVGPVVLMIHGHVNNMFSECDIDRAMIWTMDSSRPYIGAVTVRNTRFDYIRGWWNVGLAGPEAFAAQMFSQGIFPGDPRYRPGPD